MLERVSVFRRQSGVSPSLKQSTRLAAPLGNPFDNEDAPGQARKRRHMFRFGLILALLSIIAGFSTYFILTGLTPIYPSHNVVVTVWYINAILILVMAALIAWQITALWRARRRQQAGAGLHVRIVSLFSIVALFPAILLAVFASISIDRGLDEFSTRTRAIIQATIDAANAAIKERVKFLAIHTIGVARELEENSQLYKENAEGFRAFASALALERHVPFAYIVDAGGHPVVELTHSPEYPFVPPTAEALVAAKAGYFVESGIYEKGAGDFKGARGLKKLNNFDNLYLYIMLPFDAALVDHLRATQKHADEYKALEQRRLGEMNNFALTYLVIALTLLMTSIWVGLFFATKLVAPIRKLINAAQDVSRGNLSIAVKVESPRSDMGRLSATFNQMTTELRNQRNALIEANSTLDERRRFTEAVLSGVTAGVIGVDGNNVITLANSSGRRLLGRSEKDLIGKPITEAVPEFATIVAKVPKNSRKAVQSQIKYRSDGPERTFSVRITQEGAGPYGFVVTFDDITDLEVAQRTSAWADVAQRIAHEIKNPLTPIQLSAERIRRKYGAHITADREIFDRCTDTIIRHVGDIGRMVDEFSAFARTPKPVFEQHDINGIVREAVILFQMSGSEIDYHNELLEAPLVIECDRRLLTQAVTNLVKNASEAIATAKTSGKKEDNYRGDVTARIRSVDGRCIIEVIDNGCGLPQENRHRLTEPYVTTRQKGTGLGLAIVQRIAEQHEGVITLDDVIDEAGTVTGAVVRLNIPVAKSAGSAEVVEVPDQVELVDEQQSVA